MRTRIFVRIEPDEFPPGSWMVTVQTEGYPKTTGFVEGLGDTVGLGGSKESIKDVAREVIRETQQANPNAEIIFEEREN